jgi:hypothetical protein
MIDQKTRDACRIVFIVSLLLTYFGTITPDLDPWRCIWGMVPCRISMIHSQPALSHVSARRPHAIGSTCVGVLPRPIKSRGFNRPKLALFFFELWGFLGQGNCVHTPSKLRACSHETHSWCPLNYALHKCRDYTRASGWWIGIRQHHTVACEDT